MAGAMGATIHMHYCMGDFAGVSLISHEEHKCGKCGMVKKTTPNGCCEDVHKTFRTGEHYKTALAFDINAQLLFVVPTPTCVAEHSNLYTSIIREVNLPIHPPPNEITGLPLYLQLRNLRI